MHQHSSKDKVCSSTQPRSKPFPWKRLPKKSSRNMLRLRSLLSTHTGSNSMSTVTQTDQARAWDLIKKIAIPMLTTWNGRKLHARPMAAYARREESLIYFLFDVRQHKDDEVEAYPE